MPPKDTPARRGKPRGEYELYLVCSGEAVECEEGGYAEGSECSPTAPLRKKMREMARGLRGLGLAVDWIVCSPYLCAVETAMIIAESLESSTPVEWSSLLVPGASAEALISFLAGHANRNRTLLVGHEPDLSELATRLIGLGPDTNLTFRKGGCCMIAFAEFPPRSPGQLVWWLTPRVLRRMA